MGSGTTKNTPGSKQHHRAKDQPPAFQREIDKSTNQMLYLEASFKHTYPD